jgi:hypothetical protein
MDYFNDKNNFSWWSYMNFVHDRSCSFIDAQKSSCAHHFVALCVQDLVYSRWMDEDGRSRGGEGSEGVEEDHSLVARSIPSTCMQHKVHSTFRLWITTRAEGPRIIPGGSHLLHALVCRVLMKKLQSSNAGKVSSIWRVARIHLVSL